MVEMNKVSKKHLFTFLETREQEGFRDRAGMKKNVMKLFAYLKEKGLSITDVRFVEAMGYQGWLVTQKRYVSGSICNFMKGAKAFYGYLKKSGIVYANPFAEVRRMREEKKLPQNILREKEMHCLLSSMRDFSGTGKLGKKRLRYRMHVLAEFLYSTACRISEAAQVRPGDIDFRLGTVEIKDVKSEYKRVVFLSEYCKEVLWLYVMEMKDEILTNNNNKKMLFGAKGGRLCELMNRELSEVTHREHLPLMTSHGFRHAVGYHLLRAGCGIRQIQEILGHRAIRNTEVYTKVDKEELKKILDRFHPRSNIKSEQQSHRRKQGEQAFD